MANLKSNSNTNKLPPHAINAITNSLQNIRGWGSVEIFIQNFEVTQVIEKNIIKPLSNSK